MKKGKNNEVVIDVDFSDDEEQVMDEDQKAAYEQWK